VWLGEWDVGIEIGSDEPVALSGAAGEGRGTGDEGAAARAPGARLASIAIVPARAMIKWNVVRTGCGK